MWGHLCGAKVRCASTSPLGWLWLAETPSWNVLILNIVIDVQTLPWYWSLTVCHMVWAREHSGHPAELCDSRDVPTMWPHPLPAAGKAHTRTHFHTYTIKLIMFRCETLLSRVWKVFALIFTLIHWACVCVCVCVCVSTGSGWRDLCVFCRGNGGEDGGSWGHRSERLPRRHVEQIGLLHCNSGVSVWQMHGECFAQAHTRIWH